jgi:hypothetical protein
LLFFLFIIKASIFVRHAVLLLPPQSLSLLLKTDFDELLRAKIYTTDSTVLLPVDARQATRSQAAAPNPRGTVTTP